MASYSKKDFKVDWFSGTGKGGQHRNKHQNCVRITHITTGLRAIGQRSRDRQANLKDAFTRLAGMLLALNDKPAERRSTNEIVRTYHFEDGYALDHATRIKASPQSVLDGDLDSFVLSLDRESDRPKSGRA